MCAACNQCEFGPVGNGEDGTTCWQIDGYFGGLRSEVTFLNVASNKEL